MLFSSRLKKLLILSTCFLVSTSTSQGAVLGKGNLQSKDAKNSKLLKFPSYASDRVIVRFKDGVTESTINMILNRISTSLKISSVKIAKTFKSKELKQIKVLHVPSGKVKDVIRELRTKYKKYIKYAEPDYKVKMLSVPNDTDYGKQWEWSIIQAPDAWDLTTGSSDIVVGVIDTGVDYNHPDLADNIWNNDAECNGQQGVDDDNNGYIDDCHGWNAVDDNGDPMDDVDHGTHVAGTIGAVTNNGKGVAGVNWNIKIAACKFLDRYGSGFTSDAVECFDYFNKLKDEGVNIVATNNSWGGPGYSQALYDAIKASQDRGILTVVAAGNEGMDIDVFPEYPAAYDLPSIISVAASDYNDQLAWFSNYGKSSVDLAAPGGTASRDQTEDIYSTCSEDPNSWICPSGELYGYMAGTSMATPHVTGAVALLASYFTDDNLYQLRNKIFLGTDKSEAFEDTLTGGRLNLYKSLTLTDETMLRDATDVDFYWYIFDPSTSQLSVSAKILSIDKNGSADWVRVSVGGTVSTLYDNGQNGDRFAGDGYFEGTVLIPNKPIFQYSISDSFGNTESDYGGFYDYPVGYFDNYTVIKQAEGTSLSLRLNSGIGGEPVKVEDVEKLPLSYYDDAAMVIPLPFTVHFYGYPVNRIAISTNGVIVPFSDDIPLYTYLPVLIWWNEELGSNSPFNSPIIAPLWSDLNPSACQSDDCGVYMITMGNEVIFEWRNVPFYGQGNPADGVTFRVVFDKDESVRFEYLDVTVGDSQFDNGKSATVGLQFNKDHAVQYSYNESDKLKNGQVLYFAPKINQIFADVPNDDPNRHYINRLYLLGYTTGYMDNGVLNFHPNETLTRAQLVVFLDKMRLGVEGDFDYSQTPYFNDVPKDSWMFKWVQKAYELGITKGCGNGNFCPNASVTKAQMAVFMVRQALGGDDFSYNTTPYFRDVPSTHWAFKWVQKAYELGLAKPCDNNGNFCPNQNVTRADMAKQIISVLEEK